MKLDSTPRKVRLWLCVPVAVLVVAIGLSLADRPNHRSAQDSGEAGMDPAAHAQRMRDEEIARRFSRGAALLNAKQYEAAAGELHRVLELAPQMPEAHADMGFAMIGLQRYAMAKNFFEGAIALRRDQRNAYFGLAIALEGLGDLPAALGAMRSYVHLSKADDPYSRKANAAIWEWEDALKKNGTAGQSVRLSGPLPANEKTATAYPIREKKID